MTNVIHTPQSFLDAEYKRIEGSWFWKAFMHHVATQGREHVKLALGLASGDERNLRVAAAMASAFDTVMRMPDAIRAGTLLLPGQVVGNAPSKVRDADDDEREGDEE